MTRVAALMRDLADINAQELRTRLSLPVDEAAELGMHLAERFCAEVGGEQIYVPMGYAVRISERDRSMYDEYIRSGKDIRATAKAFNCSIHTVYRRVALVEAADVQARQGALFDAPQ